MEVPLFMTIVHNESKLQSACFWALTNEGWVMVEGNFGPFIIWQYATGKGIGLELEKMKCRLIKKQNESWGFDKR